MFEVPRGHQLPGDGGQVQEQGHRDRPAEGPLRMHRGRGQVQGQRREQGAEGGDEELQGGRDQRHCRRKHGHTGSVSHTYTYP